MNVAKSIRKITWRIVRGGPGRRPRVLTVPTTNGILSFSNMDVVIAKGLYIGRSWEFDFITKTIAYLRQEGYLSPTTGDLMVDVGANIGMICIAMLQHGYFREALAFEPGAENFSFLERNVHQNGMDGRIHAYQCGLSDESTEMIMELSPLNFGDHRLRVSAAAIPTCQDEEQRQTVRVPVRSLDEVLTDNGAPNPERIGLVWIDTQGHEGQFFKGARRTLSRGVPVVSELWPYGIRRAGLRSTDFADIVGPLFDHFVHVDVKSLRFERQTMSSIADLFDAFPRPQDFGEVIFLPHRRPAAL